MTETIGMIIEEIRETKRELKSVIEAVEVRLILKIEEIKNRLTKLEIVNQQLEEKAERLERKNKENNIIIFGLKHTGQNITTDFITGEIKRLVGVEVQHSDLNNFYTLGKKESCPVKIEFVSFLKKSSILANAKKLKGTNISISNDMTIKQREDYKILKKHLYLAREDKNTNCYIKNNKLHVNGIIYSVEDLEQSENVKEIEEKSNSAPGTPSAQNHTKEFPKVLEKVLMTRNQKQTPTESPVLPPNETVKKTLSKKDSEDQAKIETRSKVTKNPIRNTNNP